MLSSNELHAVLKSIVEDVIPAVLKQMVVEVFEQGQKYDELRHTNSNQDEKHKKDADRRDRYMKMRLEALQIDKAHFEKKYPGRFATVDTHINICCEIEKLEKGICLEVPYSFV